MKRCAAWLPAVMWMAIIFGMSAMPGDVSGEQSGRLVTLLCALFRFLTGGDVPPESLYALETLVRKGAHFMEYALLGALYLYALCASGVRAPYAVSLALSALYACSDEIHQAFVPGRGPAAADVLLDTLGAACSLALLRAISAVRKRKSKPS